MGRYVLDVPDMSCMHCVRRIEQVLTDMGVSDLEISLEEKSVQVSAGNIREVMDALDDAGYPASIREN